MMQSGASALTRCCTKKIKQAPGDITSILLQMTNNNIYIYIQGLNKKIQDATFFLNFLL